MLKNDKIDILKETEKTPKLNTESKLSTEKDPNSYKSNGPPKIFQNFEGNSDDLPRSPLKKFLFKQKFFEKPFFTKENSSQENNILRLHKSHHKGNHSHQHHPRNHSNHRYTQGRLNFDRLNKDHNLNIIIGKQILS